MTKAEIYEKAWALAQKNDFSLVDEIYHPDYKSFDFRTGIYANLEDDKVIVSTLDEECTYGPYEIIYENDEFLCFYKYVKSQIEGENEPSFETFMHAINYKDGKIIKQKTTVQDLDFDPSGYFEWNWKDYE
jgi:hypothetical protein